MIKAIIFDFFGVIRIDTMFGARLNDELIKYISDLKKNYKIGLISNSSGDSFNHFLNESQKQLFDQTIFSQDVNIYKPDPKIYQYAAEQLGVDPGRCLYVDDFTERVVGAERAGMQSILYQNLEQFKEDLKKLLTASPNN